MGMEPGKGCFLIKLDENMKAYKPVADMLEITVSEYNKLLLKEKD